jgi:DNA-binding CsgD family transcriptional regulator
VEHIQTAFAGSIITAFATSSSVDDFCKQLVHKVLGRHSATGALICVLDKDSTFRKIGSHGRWDGRASEGFEPWDNSEITTCLSSGKVVCFDSHDKHLENSSKGFFDLSHAVSYALLPLISNPNAVGLLAIGFAVEEISKKIDEEELRLAALASEYFAISSQSSIGKSTGFRGALLEFRGGIGNEELTPRQLSILKFMSEGRTNYQIDRALNLSESSIKQETVRIFRALGVRNRTDAAAAGAELKLI